MDFLEDLALYDLAMNNAFEFITQRKTLEELYSHMDLLDQEYPLPFDPTFENGRTEDVLDMLIEHFTHYEEYEKCAVLVKIKNQCLKKQIE
jgi:hypothetical protein|tara:strand:+ start:4365 stop:4637 length:273 start_codon:yes stop_codon:yes gene_type:complete